MTREEEIRELVARALAEDLGAPIPGSAPPALVVQAVLDLHVADVTSTAVVPEEATASASIVQKQPGVISGLDPAREAFAQTGAGHVEALMEEGEWHQEVPATVITISGSARGLLAAERVALNFLGHLSGVATLTARFVRAVEGTGVRILDTRKTTPGLRFLEKEAVAAGGGVNHRMGLHDAVLIKENHAILAGGVGEAVRAARDAHPELPIEAECRTPEEVSLAAEAGAGRLLLDNMSPEELRAAVETARESGGEEIGLEASGGVTLDNVAEVAATGVGFISVGALTHSAPALDLSMLMEGV